MALSKKVKTAKPKKAEVKSAKSADVKSVIKSVTTKGANVKSGDNDGGAGPTGPPKGKKMTAPPDEAQAMASGASASVMAKAAAIGAHNAGAGPALGQTKPGTPVRFTGSAQSTATEFSAGAAPDYLFGKTN
jgi:hypothetical protein